jgi:hypothetical protein
VTILSFVGALSPAAQAAVNLEWRPIRLSTVVGDIVEARLFAVSDSEADVPISGMDLVFSWDAALLRLLVNVDPCSSGPCDPGTYNWLQSNFPVQSALNDSFDDGDAYFIAFAQLGIDNAAIVTPDGLWVTSFRFAVVGSGVAAIRIEPTCDGCTEVTRVVDGVVPGLDVTGSLGPPAVVTIVECAAPTAEAIGSRYLEVTPGPALNPVALRVEGDPSDPQVACVTAFVQPDGSLGDTPAYQLPDDWGAIAVFGSQIRPASEYQVMTECQVGAEQTVAATAVVRTWAWGDTNGSGGTITTGDWTRIVDGSNGVFQGDTRWENVDLMPCVPDGVIDDLDVAAGRQAVFNGGTFDCEPACNAGPGLSEFALLASCVGGPGEPITPECEACDMDLDADCDLFDFAEFQTLFGVPTGQFP